MQVLRPPPGPFLSELYIIDIFKLQAEMVSIAFTSVLRSLIGLEKYTKTIPNNLNLLPVS